MRTLQSWPNHDEACRNVQKCHCVDIPGHELAQMAGNNFISIFNKGDFAMVADMYADNVNAKV